jgi:hypothetical protein
MVVHGKDILERNYTLCLSGLCCGLCCGYVCVWGCCCACAVVCAACGMRGIVCVGMCVCLSCAMGELLCKFEIVGCQRGGVVCGVCCAFVTVTYHRRVTAYMNIHKEIFKCVLFNYFFMYIHICSYSAVVCNSNKRTTHPTHNTPPLAPHNLKLT